MRPTNRLVTKTIISLVLGFILPQTSGAGQTSPSAVMVVNQPIRTQNIGVQPPTGKIVEIKASEEAHLLQNRPTQGKLDPSKQYDRELSAALKDLTMRILPSNASFRGIDAVTFRLLPESQCIPTAHQTRCAWNGNVQFVLRIAIMPSVCPRGSQCVSELKSFNVNLHVQLNHTVLPKPPVKEEKNSYGFSSGNPAPCAGPGNRLCAKPFCDGTCKM